MNKMQGKIVSEEEVAKGLGFLDVFELRKWQTDLGKQVFELKDELRRAKEDAKSLRWHGRRMRIVLEKIQQVFKDVKPTTNGDDDYLDKLILAIEVVCGRVVDWDNTLKEWWDESH